jgi:hypothetical protein
LAVPRSVAVVPVKSVALFVVTVGAFASVVNDKIAP